LATVQRVLSCQGTVLAWVQAGRWIRRQDSNLRSRVQSPKSFRWTTPEWSGCGVWSGAPPRNRTLPCRVRAGCSALELGTQSGCYRVGSEGVEPSSLGLKGRCLPIGRRTHGAAAQGGQSSPVRSAWAERAWSSRRQAPRWNVEGIEPQCLAGGWVTASCGVHATITFRLVFLVVGRGRSLVAGNADPKHGARNGEGRLWFSQGGLRAAVAAKNALASILRVGPFGDREAFEAHACVTATQLTLLGGGGGDGTARRRSMRHRLPETRIETTGQHGRLARGGRVDVEVSRAIHSGWRFEAASSELGK
jgi:hypothetical protein